MVIEWMNGESLEIPSGYTFRVKENVVYIQSFEQDQPRYMIPLRNIKEIIY